MSSARSHQRPASPACFRLGRLAGRGRALTALCTTAGTAAGLGAAAIMLFRAQGRLARKRIGKPLGELAPPRRIEHIRKS